MLTLVLTLVRRVFVLARKARPTEYLDVIKSVNDQTGSLGARTPADRRSLNDSADLAPARYRGVIAREERAQVHGEGPPRRCLR